MKKKKKIWINWVNSLNQVNPSNLGFVSWKFDNEIEKKNWRVNPELTGLTHETRLTHQTRNPCHESLITK